MRPAQVKLLFPFQMPLAFWLAPGVAVPGFMTPVLDVLDGDNGRSKPPQSRQVVRSPFAKGGRFTPSIHAYSISQPSGVAILP